MTHSTLNLPPTPMPVADILTPAEAELLENPEQARALFARLGATALEDVDFLVADQQNGQWTPQFYVDAEGTRLKNSRSSHTMEADLRMLRDETVKHETPHINTTEYNSLSNFAQDIAQRYAAKPTPGEQSGIDPEAYNSFLDTTFRQTIDYAVPAPNPGEKPSDARAVAGYLAAGAIRKPSIAASALTSSDAEMLVMSGDHQTLEDIMRKDQELAQDWPSDRIATTASEIRAQLRGLHVDMPAEKRYMLALLAYGTGTTADDPNISNGFLQELHQVLSTTISPASA